MRLYLVRHGQSVGNERQLFFGWTDYPLTELGRAQADEVAEKLRTVPFTRCVSSDLSRAWETAQRCVVGRGVPIEPCPGVREQNMGRIEGMSWEEVGTLLGEDGRTQFVTDWLSTAPPEGESPDQMRTRIGSAIEAITASDEDTLLVAHNGSLALVLLHLGLIAPAELHTAPWQFRHGCYSAVELSGSHAELLAFNV
jgi:broad specificity phosphatase PhoE